jgi:tetratricopeptide (TPR) repeat protein
VVLALALAAGASASCGKTSARAKEKVYPVAGVVIEAPGRFDVLPQGADSWLPGAPGSCVLYGDTIRNGAGGGLVLALSKGGMLRAGEATEIEIGALRAGALSFALDRGEAWLELNAGTKATVKTQVATVTVPAASKTEACAAGVKAVPVGPTTVTVAAGTAKVEAAQTSVTLDKGSQTVCEQGKQPTKPARVEARAPSGGFLFLVGLQSALYFSTVGTRDNAEDEARSKLAINPDDAWSYVNLGRALSDAGNGGDARASFEKALSIKPGFSQALAGIGKTAIAVGNWIEASKYYDLARQADRSSLEALLGSAAAALGAGATDDAEKWYKATLDSDTQNQTALTGLGLLGLLNGDPANAADDLDQALLIQPSWVPALEVSSYVYAMRGNLERSLARLESAVESDPNDYRVRSAVADRCLRKGAGADASSAFKVLSGSKDAGLMAIGFAGMGAVAQASGDEKTAITDWSKAQELVPDVPAVLENLGQAQLLSGDAGAAATTLARATSVDAGDRRAHELLARVRLAQGLNAEAVAEARTAVALAPGDWSAHLALGLALEAGGSAAEGAAEVAKALSLKPESKLPAADHVMLAEALGRQGKTEQAMAEYRLAQSSDPSNGTYHRLAAEMLLSAGKTKDALAELRKAVKLAPADMTARTELARALYSSGQKSEAIKTLEAAVKKDPNDPGPRAALGEFLLADGDVDGALFQLEAARDDPGMKPDVLASVLILMGNASDRRQDFTAAAADYARAISTDPSRGDAWFYLAGDLERTGKPADAKAAYANAAALCKDKADWKKFYDEASAKLRQLK